MGITAFGVNVNIVPTLYNTGVELIVSIGCGIIMYKIGNNDQPTNVTPMMMESDFTIRPLI